MRKNLEEKNRELKGKLSLLAISTFLLLFSTFLLFTTPVYSLNRISNPDLLSLECDNSDKEECTVVFHSDYELNEPVEIEDITVIELEEDVIIGFDTKKFLPKGFNPLKGYAALDWSKIELIELEEEVNIDFVSQYLPNDPKLINSLYPQSWNTIVLNDLKNNTIIEFNISKYLSTANKSVKSLNAQQWNDIILKELEKNTNKDLDVGI